MASPVALFLDELVTAINSPAGQAALGGGVPAARGYQTNEELKTQQSFAIWISPASWLPIGRCGELTLNKQLIEVRLVHKQPAPENAVLDLDVAKAEALRVLLQDFRGAHGGRVEQILGPLNLDRDKLTSNQASIGLVLDCDILTGTVSEDEEPDAPGRLTIARNVVWTAVENWEPLVGSEESPIFLRTYKTSADFAELQLRDPAPDELPAIALYWGDIKPDWRNNRMQEWPIAMRIAVWVSGHRHTYAETLIEHVFDAIYRYKATGDSAPLIEKTLGYPPRRVDDLTIQSVALGRAKLTHALRADVAITLRSNKDPFGDA